MPRACRRRPSSGGPIVRYDIMTTVPENSIPFVPEHVQNDNRQIQLRRAAMPRYLVNDPAPTFERVRPRTTLMSEGLDKKQPYRIHEEEVSRAGTHVLQSFSAPAGPMDASSPGWACASRPGAAKATAVSPSIASCRRPELIGTPAKECPWKQEG